MIRNARIRLGLSALAAVLSLSLAIGGEWLRPQRAQAATPFVVNTVGDDNDATPGNGVCETADGNGFCTLRAAVQEANLWPGDDRIVFSANIPTPAILALTRVGDDDTALNGDLDITSNLDIAGRGMDETIIDAGPINDRIFDVGPGVRVTLSGLTVRNGHGAPWGGAVQNRGSLTLTHTAVLTNHATSFGGGIFSSGPLSLIDSLVRTNFVITGYGGGIYSGGRLTVIRSTVRGNLAGHDAGGIRSTNQLWIEDSVISHNTAFEKGGGLWQGSNWVSIRTSTIVSNSGGSGGAIYASLTAVTLTQVTIGANVSQNEAGGIQLYSAVASLMDSTVRGNQAATYGGGIVAEGLPYQPGRLTIRNSTLNANTAGTQGGALYNTDNHRTALINSTLSNNNANTYGGGIALISGTLGLTSTTVAGNLADSNGNGTGPGGGGLRVLAGQARLWNTIVAYNLNATNGIAYPDDCLGTLFVANYLLLGDTSDCTIANGSNNLLDQDARLSPLADNGGPTQTRALKRNSPAIDRGASTDCPPTDQRGYARPQDGDGDSLPKCDLGAYEYVRPGPFLPVVIR